MFKPMAANAHTIRNLLALLVPDTTAAGIGNTLATIDIARNPRINQGNIFAMLKFAFSSLPFLLFARVLVSFTIVAKSPAPSEKA